MLELHQENLKAFDYALSLDRGGAPPSGRLGLIIEKRPYLPQCVQDMIQVGSARSAVWYSAGKRSKKVIPTTSISGRTVFLSHLTPNPISPVLWTASAGV